VDVLAPSESASVAWWLEHAEQCVKDIERRNKRVIVSGGTPLYLKAILFGLFDGPPAQPALRAVLEQLPGSELHARLRSVDPTAAERLHPHDVRRLVRALEVWETTGQPISAWQQQTHEQPILARSAVWLDWPRETLYRRINDRVLGMMDAGLLDELRQLTEQAPPLSKEASQALGYKEMLEHLQGKCDLPTAIQSIQIRSRQFAKRQITWFRHLPQCQPLSVSETETTNELARRVCECWGIA
jgi:tRNA dimethylallyltransferase